MYQKEFRITFRSAIYLGVDHWHTRVVYGANVEAAITHLKETQPDVYVKEVWELLKPVKVWPEENV